MSAVVSPTQAKEEQGSYFREYIRPMLRQWPVRLVLLALATELFMPFLVWQTPLPNALDYLQEVIAAFIMVLAVLYMLSRDRIPPAVLVILAATLIWVLVAFFEGQSIAATAWGWWKFFMYPIIGLFAYLTIRWPRGFADWWVKFLIGVMAFEVVVQVLQFLAGQPLGDSLAGTFGNKGVGPHNMFNMLVISLAFGHWIATRRWKLLLLALALGMAASALNGTKFYIPSIIILGVGTLGLQLISGGKLKQLFIFAVLFTFIAGATIPIFNRFVAEPRGLPLLQEYLEPDRLEGYLFSDGKGDVDGRYNLGRMLSVTYGLQLIQRDPTSFLFGMGLGARSNSAGLGIVGVGLENDLYGNVTGTGLLVRIQEQGIIGLLAMLAFFFWLMWRLYRDTKQHSDPGLLTLEFGLILFTFFWPLWLWYHNPWAHGVMMIVYWVSVGYVFSEMDRRRRHQRRLDARARSAADLTATRRRSRADLPQALNGRGAHSVSEIDPPLL